MDKHMNLSFFWQNKGAVFKGFFAKDEATSVVEFALVAPFFVVVLFAAIQIGLIMVIQNALEAAVREAARYAITGEPGDNLLRETAIKNKVFSILDIYSASIIKPEGVMINVKAFPNLSSFREGSMFVSNTFGLPGEAVFYEVSYQWDTLFPLFGSSSKLTLKGVNLVVNEYSYPTE